MNKCMEEFMNIDELHPAFIHASLVFAAFVRRICYSSSAKWQERMYDEVVRRNLVINEIIILHYSLER